MERPADPARTGLLVVVSFAAVALLVAVVLLLGHPDRSAFEVRSRERQLVATMRVQLHVAVEAEKSAVMADTDEASLEHAARARAALAAVETARRETAELVARTGGADERQLLTDFARAWEALQRVDDELLDLAVQNTNLKAQRLSAGPVAEATARLETALGTLVDSGGACPTAPETCRWAFRALAAAARLHALESPHIVEGDEGRMAAMEVEMDRSQRRAAEALDRLETLANASQRPTVAAARAAADELWRQHAEVLRLSRRNSNVRSLAISLGRKRAVTAECESLLAALQAAVDRPTTVATR